MSLQVWLPLNGDLHNQGLLDKPSAVILQSGNSFTANGKIGQCLSSTSTNVAYFQDTSNNKLISLFNSGKIYTMAFWYKLTGNGTSGSIIQIGTTTPSSGSGNGTFGFWWTKDSSGTNPRIVWNDGDNGKRILSKANDNSNIATDYTNWHHLVAIIDKTNMAAQRQIFYIDGIKVRDQIYNNSSANALTITNANNYIYFRPYYALLNDIRIYDHALSDKEVEEISKGLVLHYKLDNIGQGYSTNLVTSLTAGGQTTVTNNIVTTSGTNADTYFVINLSEDIVEGTSYIVSCDAEIPEGKCWTFPLGWQGNTSLSFQIYNGHNTYAFTANSGNWGTKRLFMDDGGSPNSARSTGVQTKLFNFCVTKSGIINDSSGYNNNGTLHDITAKLVTDTARYQQCIKNNQAANSTNYLLKGDINIPESSALTFSWWMNPTQWGHQSSGIFSTSSNSLPSDHSTTAANMRDSCFDCCNTSGTCVRINVESFITLNEWHHYVLVYNGSKLIFYKDGIQQTTANQTGNLKAFTSIWPFYSLAGGAHRNMSGSLSDFRIYVTALTEEQVLELYNTSASIDNNGDVYARELVEI